MSMSDWIQRCSEAQQAGSPWPEAALLRAVVIHDDWSVSRSGGNTDAYCTPSAAPKGADLETMEGLALAAALTQGESIRLPPVFLTMLLTPLLDNTREWTPLPSFPLSATNQPILSKKDYNLKFEKQISI